MRQLNVKGAAVRVALFFCAAVCLSGVVMPVRSPWFPAAQAKMRLDRLGIERVGRGDMRVFTIEVAGSSQEKALGLMFRTKLTDGEGMLFHYARQEVITMWMRNTYISLDMVFIRADGVVQNIVANAEPLSEAIISSTAPVAAVLEIPGGAATRLDILPGDIVRHPLFGTGAVP